MSRSDVASKPFCPKSFSAASRTFPFVPVGAGVIRMFKSYDCSIAPSSYNPTMLPFRLVYHDAYNFRLRGHVYPTHKYSLIRDRLLSEHIAEESDFVMPEPATDEDLLLAHDRAWIEKSRQRHPQLPGDPALEFPIRATWWRASGSRPAARCWRRGWLWKTASATTWAAVFTMPIRIMAKDSAPSTISPSPCGACRATGSSSAPWWSIATCITATAPRPSSPATLRCSRSRFTSTTTTRRSSRPPTSTFDLADGVGDEEYLRQFTSGCHRAFADFSPDFVIYVAGADPFREDQLGGLDLTFGGLMARDRFVFGLLREKKVPVAVTLAGGYARNVEDTVTIHLNTVKAAAES